MKLFFAPASPYSRKVRVVARELDLDMQLIHTNALSWDGDYGTLNPINRVPALQLVSGDVLFDSRVICEFLDTTYGRTLLPEAGESRWGALVRQALGDGLMDAAVPLRHETLRPSSQQSPERIRLYRRSIDQVLDRLESTIVPGPFDLGAVSIACALEYLDFRFSEQNWRDERPRLEAWHADIAQRNAMLTTRYA